MTDELLMYHSEVKKNLNCPKAMRKKFLADARRMTDDFLTENPEASLDELRSTVGEPEELAAMFLESADIKVVARYRTRKSWVKRAAVILLALAFVAVTAFSIWAAHFRRESVFTKESDIIIYETEEE